MVRGWRRISSQSRPFSSTLFRSCCYVWYRPLVFASTGYGHYRSCGSFSLASTYCVTYCNMHGWLSKLFADGKMADKICFCLIHILFSPFRAGEPKMNWVFQRRFDSASAPVGRAKSKKHCLHCGADRNLFGMCRRDFGDWPLQLYT